MLRRSRKPRRRRRDVMMMVHRLRCLSRNQEEHFLSPGPMKFPADEQLGTVLKISQQ